MASKKSTDQVIGVVLIVLGILIALGKLGNGFAVLVWVGAVAAIVVGILVLLGKTKGSQLYGILLIVAGALVLGSPYFLSGLTFVLNLVVGILVVLAGVMKFEGRW
jgi:uncharacterized membrane protein